MVKRLASASGHRRFAAVAAALALGPMVVPPLPARVAAAATFIVNSIGDAADLNLANTRCDTSTASGDQCTLRAAIQEANDTAGPDTIDFGIGGTAATKNILPASPLPPITEAVTINGYTQPGASVNTLATGNNAVFKIVLNGIDAGPDASGLRIDASDSVVRGLVINRFDGAGIFVSGSNNQIKGDLIGSNASGTRALGNAHGVILIGPDNVVGGTALAARNLISGNTRLGVAIADTAATGNKVQGSYIGTTKDGTSVLANGVDGVDINSAAGSLVGGTVTGARNVISGNGESGVRISVSAGNAGVVQGNFIGTDVTGTLDLGNGVTGVFLQTSAGAQIGGTVPAARNVISGNGVDGVAVQGQDNLVQGNFIGTDVTGTVAIGNGDDGVDVALTDNTIGGTAAGAGNVISGNGGSGVEIFGSFSPGNKVQGNRIGTRADGTGDLGNVADGVELVCPDALVGGNVISGNGHSGVRIGGGFATGNEVTGNVIQANDGVGAQVEIGPNTVGGGNLIVANGSHGVRVFSSATGVRIFANQIFANGALGIDLNGGTQDGFKVTANDTDDPDTGANDLQNFPVLTSATRSASTGVTMVAGTLNSNHSQTFTVELFMAAADPSGHGEALIFIASKSVTTNSGGDIGFTFVSPVPVAGQPLTATASNTATGNTSEFSLDRTVVAGP